MAGALFINIYLFKLNCKQTNDITEGGVNANETIKLIIDLKIGFILLFLFAFLSLATVHVSGF